MSLADLRTDYRLASLSEADVLPNPIDQFNRWFGEAEHAEVPEPNAMSIATATSDAAPSVRTVLVKGVDEQGFVFFTDYRSQKGCELLANPRAALLFFWQALERQVRIVGTVAKTTQAESEAYFRSRPVGSRIGATASVQSSTLADRAQLEARVSALESQFAKGEIPLPDYWGGFRVSPVTLEFWQGRSNRLHDRILYTLRGDRWNISRLSP